MTRAPPPGDDEVARFASVQLRRLGDRLREHAGEPLPPDLTSMLLEAIALAQDLVSGSRIGNAIDRWLAVLDCRARGSSYDDVWEDAAELLAGTPAACGADMVRTDYYTVQRARRGRFSAPFHHDADELHPPHVGPPSWRDDTG